MFRGIITALTTPFTKSGELDINAWREFINWQISEEVDGLAVLGSTGEAPTITMEERDVLVKSAIELAKNKLPTMIGCGSNSTATAIKYTQHAKECGAEAALIVAPYYNKPTQEGLYQHYKAINDNVNLDIYIYNCPSRSVVNISDETIGRLSQLKNIKGIKDASGDIERPFSLKRFIEKDDFIQLTGDDPLAVAFNASGGKGCISVASNVAPRLCGQIQQATFSGDYGSAQNFHQRLWPLYQALFCETNPVPAKYALSLLGKMDEQVRLPLVGLMPESKERVKDALKASGVY
ncbi:MAG: 4-hydroxy-tetrahydrodipicolinate synthase [Rickettsiales bacterium]